MTAIKSHLSAAELEHRYKTASEAIAKSHFHALWLLTRGYSIDQVAALLSFSTRWVRILIGRYNEGGPDRLGDQRAHNGTESKILTPEALAALRERLKSPPNDGGVDGAEDRTLAGRLPRAQVGARPARLGCSDCDRLVDPAAAPGHPKAAREQDRSRLKKTAARRRR
jgi:hypothetical protein